MDPELLEWTTARRAELDELEGQLAKQLAEVRTERDELAVPEHVLERVSGASATSGTPADADLLAAYLDRYLRRPDLYYDQPAAMGALLHLDAKLRADQAARFLAPDGLWHQWIEGPPRKEHHGTPDSYREIISQFCVFADEGTEHCTARK